VEVSEIFAQRAKTRISDLGLTHAEFASKVGTHRATVTKYLQGGTTPGADLVKRWAKHLKVTSSWLLGEEPVKVERGSTAIEVAKRLLPAIGLDAAREAIIDEILEMNDVELGVLLDTVFPNAGALVATRDKSKRPAG